MCGGVDNVKRGVVEMKVCDGMDMVVENGDIVWVGDIGMGGMI